MMAPGKDWPPIDRRDFLNGLLVGGIGLAAAPLLGHASASVVSNYPPAGTGLQGQTDDARAIMHQRRDRPDVRVSATESDEYYDLVVVGAGISGLSAAHLFQRYAGRPVRILLIDPLDDFGGHAKRNEFTAPDGRVLIGYGGSQSLDSPSLWSPAARQLLADLGIERKRFHQWFDQGWHQRHRVDGHATYFASAHWGREALAMRPAGGETAPWVEQMPLGDQARRDLVALLDSPRDYLPRLTAKQKRTALAAMSYDDFLRDVVGAEPVLQRYFAAETRGYFGVGTDAVTALDAWTLGLPGFSAMKLGDSLPRLASPSGRQAFLGTDPYIYHFPDGNAGLTRALVRRLIPAAIAGSGMEALVSARCDYDQLDRPDTPVRLRLRESVIDVRHEGAPASASSVRVTCQRRDGSAYSVRAGQAVLACWSRTIARITDELPAAQVRALEDQVKVPLIYANALLRNWRAFAAGGFSGISNPGGFWDEASIDFPVSAGAYAFAATPDEPVLVHFARVMVSGGGSSARAQATAGRAQLHEMPFTAIELEMRNLLQGALGRFGFDHERDVLAVTVNRWAHGYSYEYMRPWDSYWPDGALPIHTARRGWGRVAIANADAGAFAYAHSAIDQATRAVAELLPKARIPPWSARPGPYRAAAT